MSESKKPITFSLFEKFLLKLAELSEFEMYNKSKMQVIGICPTFSLTKALNPLNQLTISKSGFEYNETFSQETENYTECIKFATSLISRAKRVAIDKLYSCAYNCKEVSQGSVN